MENIDVITIKKRSVSGVFALISRNSVLSIISLVSSLIIFTKLDPRDIGVYAVIIAMQRIVSFFTDFGFSAALVQKKTELTQDDLSTGFTVQILVTGFIFIAAFVFSKHIGFFFNLGSDALLLFLVLIFTIFLSSFKIIPSVILERKIKFHKLVFPQVVESVLFNAILISLIVNNNGFSSFTWAFLISSLASIPFFYYVSPWKVRLGIKRKSLQHLWYGISFQTKNVLATLKDDFLTVFLTKLLTFSELGYIGFAQRIAFFPFRYIVDSVTKVSFSTYSRLQQNRNLLKDALEKSIFFVSSVMFPVLLVTIVSMPYVVEYFPKWHNKWEPALVSVVFFSLNALVSSLSNILVSILDSTGRVKTTLKLMVFWTISIWILTPMLIGMLGYDGVAIASFLVTLSIVYTVYLVKKAVNFSLIKSIYKSSIASVVTALAIYLGEEFFANNLYSLFSVIILGGVLYFLIMYVIANREFREGLKIVLVRK